MDIDKLGGKGTSKKDGVKEIEVFPPRSVAMHRIRWNVNKSSEKWLAAYGQAARLLHCHEIDPSFV